VSSIFDELHHLMRQMGGQGGSQSHVYGHISSYDPATHRIKAIIPSYMDSEEGAPRETGWMPLGSPMVGGGFGLQLAPSGGATSANPTGGEQVLISVLDGNQGIIAVPVMFFTNSMAPPSGQLTTPVQTGEAVLRHSSGSFLRFHANGDVEIQSPGVASIMASAVKLGAALTDTLHTLCTQIFYSWAVSHVHTSASPGTPTSAPTTTPAAGSLTTNLTAE
jgi:hypothetical protein